MMPFSALPGQQKSAAACEVVSRTVFALRYAVAVAVAALGGVIQADKRFKRHTKGVFALRPYQPSARRVYQPAALP
jgi:hypothetical protein